MWFILQNKPHMSIPGLKNNAKTSIETEKVYESLQNCNNSNFLEDYNDIFGSPVSDAVTGFSPSFVAAQI